MKLKCIIEKIGGSATPIRAIGDTFGVLINLLYNNPKFKKTAAAILFKNFLSKPLPSNWKNIKNKVIDEIVPMILNDPDLKNDLGDDANNLTEFKNMQDDIIVAGLMDVDMKYLSMTPLKAIAMNQNERNTWFRVVNDLGNIIGRGSHPLNSSVNRDTFNLVTPRRTMNWNVGNVRNMNFMFNEAINFVNVDLRTWIREAVHRDFVATGFRRNSRMQVAFTPFGIWLRADRGL